MGFCPFCGSPEHGTNLQVTMAEPLTGYVEGSRITVRGAVPLADVKGAMAMHLTLEVSEEAGLHALAQELDTAGDGVRAG